MLKIRYIKPESSGSYTSHQFKKQNGFTLIELVVVIVILAVIGDQEPGVVRVLNHINTLNGERWLVAHRELRSSRRIRVVYDFLAQALV